MLLILAFSIAAAVAQTAPAQPATTLVGPASIALRLPLSATLHTALATRDHSTAIRELNSSDLKALSGRQRSDHHFLLAWSHLRTGNKDKAIGLVEHVRANQSVPTDYRALTIGEIHLADGNPIEAAAAFAEIGEDSMLTARAQLQLAAAHQKAGATKAALDIYEKLAERPDPAEGNDLALWALASRAGLSNPKSRGWLKRLWIYYPLTKAGRGASAPLANGGITSRDRGERAYRLMQLGAWRSVNDTISSRLAEYPLTTELGCRVRYAHGRSLFKRNQVTNAAQILVPVGKRCVGLDNVNAPKALYVAGKSLERKKAWAEAAAAYTLIPELYPEHSMADDGYTLGGIAQVEAGEPSAARALWSKQADAYPTGDMAGEGFWRLAWSAYQDADPLTAIDWAERMVREVPLSSDPVHVIGGKYWAARWRLYPDVENPRELNPDAEAVQEGLDALVSLYNTHPSSFYSLHATNRLRELSTEHLAQLVHPEPVDPADTWSVRTEFMDHPGAARALSLARLGLVREAMAELGRIDLDLTPSEQALASSIHAHQDPYSAHDVLHRFLLHHPPSTLGADRDRILNQAYPDHYWDMLQSVASEYSFDPRIFHSLVREESSFNKDIRSWAGAKGLSQLMPATARRVGQWLNRSVSSSNIKDPELNLAIGSRYLHYLFGYFRDNPFLAVAAYNAGEGNVGKWVTRFGAIPSDEFVEHIPFRETRHYVKRVLGTYQAYRVIRGPAEAPPDWTHGNHEVGRSAR